MTNKEAKQIISDIDHAWRNFSQEEYVALEMAIKALEQITDLKEAYNKGYKDGQEALAFHYELCKEEGSIIVVPDGATNGDMIKTMFSDAEIIAVENEEMEIVEYVVKIDDETVFTAEWWNSPYREG